MSKRELKALQRRFNNKLDKEGITVDFYNRHEALKPR